MLYISCSHFPYQGVIDESARYLTEVHPEAFKSLEFQGEEFHYVSLGAEDKPLVVFIHGSPGSWKSFANFYKSDNLIKNFQLLTFDRMGYGKNREGIPHGNLADQILLPSLIIERERRENGRKVIVVGHSYGGPVAARLAMVRPDLVDGLILVASSVDPELEKMEWYQHVVKVWGVRSLLPNRLDVCNREILALKDQLIQMEDDYKLIKTPVHVIHGDLDRLVPIENIDYLKRKIPEHQATYRTLKRMRHFVPWAFPTLIEDGILEMNQRSSSL